MASADDVLREREFRGIRVALIARLVVLAIGLPIDQTLAVASRVGQTNSLIGFGAGLVAVAALLAALHYTRRSLVVGVAAVFVDVALMAGLLVGWWDSIGGAAVPVALLLKSAAGGLMTVFIALNALTLRPLYPLLATAGMAIVYLGLVALAAGDPQTGWTDDYLAAYIGPAVSRPQVAGEFALVLFVGALVVATTYVARRLMLDGIGLERVNAHLGRYFSPTVRDRISAAGDDFLTPGGHVQDVAVLFCDIRDFTRLAETLRPDELMALVSDYQARMVAAVFAHDGTLDKFIGDAVMATFGTPLPRPDAAPAAVAAAIAMRTALADLNRERAVAGKQSIQHGIGIHYGPAVVGNVGTVDRLEYTVMGDTVNVAALVADHCKACNEDLLISGAVRAQLPTHYAVRRLEVLSVKGRREPVAVFALDAGAGDVTAGNATPDFGRER